MGVISHSFVTHGIECEVVAEKNEYGEPKYKQALYCNGELVGVKEGSFDDAIEWLNNNFFRYA